jgi:hypothetical protein
VTSSSGSGMVGCRHTSANVAALDDAVAAFNRTERTKGKTIIRVHL